MSEFSAQPSVPEKKLGQEFWSTFHMLILLGHAYGQLAEVKIKLVKKDEEKQIYEEPYILEPSLNPFAPQPKNKNCWSTCVVTENGSGELEETEILTFGESRPVFSQGPDTSVIAMVGIEFKNPAEYQGNVYRFYPNGKILRNPINTEPSGWPIKELGPTHEMSTEEVYTFQNRLDTAQPLDPTVL